MALADTTNFRCTSAHRTLLAFVLDNQCEQCSGLTAAALTLAQCFALAEGIDGPPARAALCTGHDGPGEWTADDMDRFMRQVRPTVSGLFAGITTHPGVA